MPRLGKYAILLWRYWVSLRGENKWLIYLPKVKSTFPPDSLFTNSKSLMSIDGWNQLKRFSGGQYRIIILKPFVASAQIPMQMIFNICRQIAKSLCFNNKNLGLQPIMGVIGRRYSLPSFLHTPLFLSG